MERTMRDIVSDILTWPWFSEPHGYNFMGYKPTNKHLPPRKPVKAPQATMDEPAPDQPFLSWLDQVLSP